MHEFIRTITRSFSDAVVPALAVMAVGGIVLAVLYWKWYGKDGREPRAPLLKRTAAILLLLCYLGGLTAITLLHRTTGDSAIQAHLFRAFREAWNAFTLQVWLNPLLNVAMFAPLGALLPLAARPFRRWYWTLAAGGGASLLIETLQYLLRRGSADVDDLLCNTLGVMLGWCLCMIFVHLTEQNGRLAGACAVFPALCAAFLIGVFAAYELQPYGNLADAPAFTADTRGVEWTLACELSDQPGPAGVYWAEPFTKETCDDFAVGFVGRLGAEIDFNSPQVNYYDNTTFYSDHSTYSLSVDHNDRSYQYTNFKVDPKLWDTAGMATQADLLDALSELGIEVPESAEFIEEQAGLYVFRASRVAEDGVLTDGELICQVVEDGSLLRVKNALSVSTLHGEAAVISQQAAYEQLCRGWFSGGDWFEFNAPRAVRVTSCTLRYFIDSKGFRQPVYVFELEGLGPVFVPALAG